MLSPTHLTHGGHFCFKRHKIQEELVSLLTARNDRTGVFLRGGRSNFGTNPGPTVAFWPASFIF